MGTQGQQSEDDVVETSITCDNCRRTDGLESFNGNSTFRTPPGWITVTPQVGRFREDPEGYLKEMKTSDLNKKVRSMVPVLHICTDCIIDREALDKQKRKKERVMRERELAKIKAAQDNVDLALRSLTRVTSGRKIMTEDHSGN